MYGSVATKEHADEEEVMSWTEICSVFCLTGLALTAVIAPGCGSNGGCVDLSGAKIIAGADSTSVERFVASVLAEEVELRTGLSWEFEPTLTAGPAVRLRILTNDGIPPEGFRITSGAGCVVDIVASDKRGLLFGVGHFLQKLHWRQGAAGLPEPLHITTSPAYPIRGHKLGYTNTPNTYDAWTVEQYDRYIRELALSGANMIENNWPDPGPPIAPMVVRPSVMNAEMSRIAAKYGLDFWLDIAVHADLSNPEERTGHLQRVEEVVSQCSQINEVFVPGGDPGHNHPSLLLPYMEEMAEVIRRHHPEAGIWVSLQKFEPEKVEFFFNYLDEHSPTWLTGIIDGPWGPPVDVLAERLRGRYPICTYPDLTHNVRCQNPVPWWDPVYAFTLGREAANPRPMHFAGVFRECMSASRGFFSYTEGVHDNVNLVVWNALGWNPNADVREVMQDYARFHFGADVVERAAEGILALERNWYGALAENASVDSTLALWQQLEAANPQLADNWRWQLCLLRAYYDAYVRHRSMAEEALQAEALALLANAGERGSDAVMTEALAVLARAETDSVRPEWRAKIFEMGDRLHTSIGMQLSMEQGATRPERGAVLDFVDLPLNDRWWIEDEFTRIRGMGSEAQKVARLTTLAAWEAPPEGSFYDDIGNVAKSPHVVKPTDVLADPLFKRTPYPFFMWWENGRSRAKRAWQSDVHWPTMVYNDLDPAAQYMVRTTGRGPHILRMNGEIVQPTTSTEEMGEFRLYPVPSAAIAGGSLTLTWGDPDEGNIHWRQWSRVNEVWLLKN